MTKTDSRAAVLDTPKSTAQRERSEELGRFRDALLELAQIDKTDPRQALSRVLAVTGRALDVDEMSYWSWRLLPDGACLREEVRVEGRGARVAQGVALHRQQDLPRYFRTLLETQVVMADDALHDEQARELRDSYLLPRNIVSVLDVPVRHQGVLIGVMRAGHRGTPRRWTLREMDFANSVAIMVSLAFEAGTRAQMDAALRRSEARYRTLVEQASDAIVLMDAEGNLLDANPYMTQLCGYDLDDLMGMNVRSLIAPGNHPARETAPPWSTHGAVRTHCVVHHRSGRQISADVTTQSLDDGVVMAIIHDVTVHKQAQEELRRAGNDLRVILESVYDAIFTIALDNRELVDANENALALFGLTRDALRGLTLDEVMPAADGPPLEAWEAACAGVPKLFECTGRNRASNATFPVEVFLKRISLFNRDVMLCNVRDISERKRADAETARTLEREKELGALKSRFVAMTSHEFRTPLSVIMSSSELLETYADSFGPERRGMHFGRIREAVRNMANMLEQILLIGRAEAGMMELRPAAMDLERLCRVLAELNQQGVASIDRVRLTFRADLCSVVLDEILLRHIVTNLLSNGLKYSPEDKDVHLEAWREDGCVLLRVSDEGIGIPIADQGRLFESFHRASNVGTIGGTGLGLAIVARCVECHGGTVSVVSETGQGASFTVRLPEGRAA